MSEPTQPLDTSLPAAIQYLAVLENPGLARSEKVGRVWIYRIESEVLNFAERWINQRRLGWEQHFDRLGAYLETFKTQGDAHDDDH